MLAYNAFITTSNARISFNAVLPQTSITFATSDLKHIHTSQEGSPSRFPLLLYCSSVVASKGSRSRELSEVSTFKTSIGRIIRLNAIKYYTENQHHYAQRHNIYI